MTGLAADGARRSMRVDAQRNRERVLDAARAAFATEGSDVSLDEIARRAGVGAGTVYRYFASKEALFEAVVVDRLGGLAAEASALAEVDDPGAALFAFVERLAREGARKRDVAEAFGRAGMGVHVGAGPALAALAAALDAILSRAQAAKAVRADIDVADLVAVVSGAAFAISRSSGDEPRVRTIMAVLTDGLRVRG